MSSRNPKIEKQCNLDIAETQLAKIRTYIKSFFEHDESLNWFTIEELERIADVIEFEIWDRLYFEDDTKSGFDGESQ
jgi:hypothetical protein